MKTQAIGMQPALGGAYSTRQSSNKNFNGGTTLVAVPVYPKEDTFVTWAAKNVITASVFSLVWDLGTNAVAKYHKNVETIPVKQMFKNVPRVAGIFLLIGGIFRIVNNAIDRN